MFFYFQKERRPWLLNSHNRRLNETEVITMSNIIETWMPFGLFVVQYPEYHPQILLKINDYIVFYEINCFPHTLYFSLEEAHAKISTT